MPTGVAWGVATTVGVGGRGVVFAAAGVGARVGWAGTGSGVGNRSGVGGGAVARAGWMVARAVFEGWFGSAATGGSAWAVAVGESGAGGDNGVESVGDAPEPEAPELVDAGSSHEDASAWLRW